MKLHKSIKPLKDAIASLENTDNFYHDCSVQFKEKQNNPKIKDAHIAFRYTLWYALDKVTRNDIIKASELETIGGYAGYMYSHLDTLLNKVITNDYIDNICKRG